MGEFLNYNTFYLEQAINHRDRVVTEARANISNLDFDTMIGTGMSGALVIPKLAEALGKEWFIVRKPTENAHSKLIGEGKIGRRWLFVDDLISTGRTANRVITTIADLCVKTSWHTEFIGAYVYGGEGRPAAYLSPEEIKVIIAKYSSWQ